MLVATSLHKQNFSRNPRSIHLGLVRCLLPSYSHSSRMLTRINNTQAVLFTMALLYRIYTTLAALFLRHDPTDHFAPHAYAGFEGYYSRVQLDDGGTLAVIFCWVKEAEDRPRLVHVSYTPAQSCSEDASMEGFKHEFFPGTLAINVYPPEPASGSQIPFSVRMSGVGTMKVGADSVDYHVSHPSAGGKIQG